MNPDDDPTRALDDFVRRMRPDAPRPDPPELGDTLRRPAPRPTAHGAPPCGGARRPAGDVTDVPSIDLPALADPSPPDALVLDATVIEVGHAAAAGFATDAEAAAKPWQPDIDKVLERRARNPRMLAAWRPGCWTGAVREVFEASTEFIQTSAGPVVETYPPHRLLLAWSPRTSAGPFLGRWPDQVRLCAVPRDTAAEVLLAQLPDGALLWIGADDAGVDWALAAEIVLHHEPGLRPFQIDALRAFIAAEREASFARVNTGYAQMIPGAAVMRRDDA